MNKLLFKLIKKQTISEEDIKDELNSFCSINFSKCKKECPLIRFEILGMSNGFYESIYKEHNEDTNTQLFKCPYYRDGNKILKALERHFKEREK